MTVPLTESCEVLGCATDALRCHRCGGSDGVVERFVVDNPLPCLAGVTPKMTGHFTHTCDLCAAEWAALVADHYGVS